MPLVGYKAFMFALLLMVGALPSLAMGAEKAPLTRGALRLESFGELLDADSVDSLRRIVVSAVSLAPEEGQGMAVINDKILHPGDMFGLVQLLYLGPDTVILAFNGKNYVLRPSKRRAAEGADALP